MITRHKSESNSRQLLIAIAIFCTGIVATNTPASAQSTTTRIATFNCSLNRSEAGQLIRDLSENNVQAQKVAAVLRSVQPDIVLLNEFDYDSAGKGLQLFQDKYLEATLSDFPELKPLTYPYSFSAEVNTGVATGLDLDKDGKFDGGGDAFGYGLFPGQYGMVLLSKLPIDKAAVRTFQKLLWKDMPGCAMPIDSVTNLPWYTSDATALFRLSSKSHWDIPITLGAARLHVLAAHPTPPAFNGPEDRNGRRNHDEIRLWAEYLREDSSEWLKDDQGKSGSLAADQPFVILGDLNADPLDGNSYQNAIQQLLQHPRVNSTFVPESSGAAEASQLQDGINATHKGAASSDTSDFSDRSVGNLRVDYVLPSQQFRVVSGGVFWPKKGESLAEAAECSDHRLVWLDVMLPNTASEM